MFLRYFTDVDELKEYQKFISTDTSIFGRARSLLADRNVYYGKSETKALFDATKKYGLNLEQVQSIKIMPEVDMQKLKDDFSRVAEQMKQHGAETFEDLLGMGVDVNADPITETIFRNNPKAEWNDVDDMLKTLQVSMTKTSAASKALAVAGNMALSMFAAWAATKAVEVLISVATASERATDAVKHVGEAYQSIDTSLDGYKSRIEELKQTINSSTATEQERLDARKELLEIQDEMIASYGNEASSISSVQAIIADATGTMDTHTSSIRSAAQAWKELAANAREAAVRESDAADSTMDKIGNAIRYGTTSSYRAGKIQYNRFQSVVDTTQAAQNEALLNFVRENPIVDFNTGIIKGTAREVADFWEQYYTIAENSGRFSEQQLSAIMDNYDEAASLLDNIEPILFAEIGEQLEDATIYDPEYKKTIDNIDKLKEEYNDALVNNDMEIADPLRQQIVDGIKEATEKAKAEGHDELVGFIEDQNQAFMGEVKKSRLKDAISDTVSREAMQGYLSGMLDDQGNVMNLEQIQEMARLIRSATSQGRKVEDLGYSTDTLNNYNKFLELVNNQLNDGLELAYEFGYVFSQGISSETQQINEDFEEIKSRLATTIVIAKQLDNATKDFTDDQKKAWIDAAQGVKTYQELLDNVKISEAANMNVDVVNIASETAKIEELNKLLTTSVATGLTDEDIGKIESYYSALDSYDASALFEKTASGVHLNREEMAKLNAEMRSSVIDEFENKQRQLADGYLLCKEKIDDASISTEEFINTNRKLKAIEENARSLELLASQYAGLTSAYQEFVNAQAAPDERTAYAGIIDSFEKVQKLIKNGWWGDEEVRSYLQIFSYDDLADASVDQLQELYKNLGKKIGDTGFAVTDFFTKNDDGETTTGINNFFQFIHDQFGENWAKLDQETGRWIVDLSGDRLNQVAETAGMHISTATELLKTSRDTGASVWLGIENYTEELAGLYISMDDAIGHLKSLGVDVGVDTSEITESTEQVEAYGDSIKKLNDFLNQNVLTTGGYDLNVDGVKEAIVALDEYEKQILRVKYANMALMQEDATANVTNPYLKSTIEDLQALQVAYDQMALIRQKQGISSEERLNVRQQYQDALAEALSEDNLTALKTLGLSDLLEIKPDDALKAQVQQTVEESLSGLSEETISKADFDMGQITMSQIKFDLTGQEKYVQEAVDQFNIQIPAVIKVSDDNPFVKHPEQSVQSEASVDVSVSANNAPTEIQNDIDAGSYEVKNVNINLSDIGSKISNWFRTNVFTIKTRTDSPSVSANGARVRRSGAQASNGNFTKTPSSDRWYTHNSMSGTASAYGRGNRGKDLVGELGTETVVDPGKGVYYTVGENGAELVDLPKDAIVFNHKQTSQLFGKGRTSRGTAMAYGNAYGTTNTIVIDNGAKADGPVERVSGDSTITQQLDNVAKKIKDVGKAAKDAAKDAKDAGKDADDILSELSKQLDEIQSAYSTLSEIVDSYNENGKLTIDQAQALITTDFKYLALLTDENGKLKLNAEGFQELAKIKLYEMQVQLARNALETVKSLTDEAKAAEFLKNSYKDLANAELSVEEAALRAAVAQKEALGGSQAEAAKKILAGYEATKKAIGNIDFSKEGFGIKDSSSSSSKKDKEEEKRKEAYEKQKSKMEAKLDTTTIDWVEKLLNKIQKTISDWTDSMDRMWEFWNKNWAANKAIQNIQKEREYQAQAYKIYMDQATKAAKVAGMSVQSDDKKYTNKYVGGYALSQEYIKKIQNGDMSIEVIPNTKKALADKISAYEEWWRFDATLISNGQVKYFLIARNP